MKKLLLVEVPTKRLPDDAILDEVVLKFEGYVPEYKCTFKEIIITEEEIEAYALDNILAEDSLEAFENVRKFQEGAIWMLNKIMEEK
jgi:hypothetical protein